MPAPPPMARGHAGESPNPRRGARLLLLRLVFALIFCVVAARVTQLHLTPANQLGDDDREHIGERALAAPRGNIYDRSGTPLATDRRVASIWADPRAVPDPTRLALLLNIELGLEESFVIDRLSRRDSKGYPRKFIWLKRWLVDHTELEVEALLERLGAGVYARYEPLRFYPQRDTAAHVVGYTNRVGDASAGVELLYDEVLRGEPGYLLSRVDSDRNLLDSMHLQHRPAQRGHDVVLTIDTAVQHTLEVALDRVLAEKQAKQAMGMLLDPYTGAILAFASRPAFDPNRYNDATDAERKNSAVTDVFEPGSAFKMLTAAALLEEGLVTLDTKFDCEMGVWRRYGHRIRDVHHLGEVPFREVIVQSSNIGTIKAADRLGEERLYAWVRNFGFGRPATTDFTGESWGLVHPLEKWHRTSMNAVPMGQEIAVTLPQLARLFAVIANGGRMITPHVVAGIRAPGSDTLESRTPPVGRRIISEETAALLRELARAVVEEPGGTGWRAALADYTVGGKTGTAQVALPNGQGYSEDKRNAVFGGFAPVEQPALAGVVVVREPAEKPWSGGQVAAPVFREVMQKALVRLNVPKSPPRAVPVLLADSGEPEPLYPGGIETVGAGRVEPDAPAPDEAHDRMAGATAAADAPAVPAPIGPGQLPDLRGLTKVQVKAKLAALGVAWDARGAGRVVSQQPEPGTPLAAVRLCRLDFAGVPAREEHADDA